MGKKPKSGFLRRLIMMPFLHSNGRPRKWLYKRLFQKDGTPRRYARLLVQNREGRPRFWLRRWSEELARKRILASGGLDVPILWFFMGDTLDWLSSHAHVTGVGRVTTELFRGGLDGSRPPLWYPAIAGGAGVQAWQRSRRDQKAPPGVPQGVQALRDLFDTVPSALVEPKAGDHVLFTGVVWNAHYVRLFRQLSQKGIGFSVLVHDIIPILDPSLTEPRQLAEFVEWLEEVVTQATVVFVSCAAVRADIEAWCASHGLASRAPIIIVPFGPSIEPAQIADAALRPEVTRPYVLSVGTIDRRKNQSLLLRVWRRLLEEVGAARLPMLVLVGRDDLGLAGSEDAAVLVGAGRLSLLGDVGDGELDRLYRDCLFTAFPSTIEGYGLPVADSLAYGKLPVVADLPPIREYAGDLPLYFDPRDEDDAMRALRRAIEDAEFRNAAETQIATWCPPSWSAAADAVYAPLMLSLTAKDSGNRLLPALKHEFSEPELHALAQPWVSEAPVVSILIVNWNAAAMTRLCVEHIWARTSGVSYEILIADNGSRRSDLALLRDIGPGVRVFPLGVNRYFGEANNIIAEQARGRVLCLLNNDVFVSAGWLDRMVHELDAHQDVGAVGPVFLFPDDTIQEAGGMLSASGVPIRQLRGEPASALAGQAPEDVDYISAAALVISRETFAAVGGFDLAYEPAYYEDTDLCFKLAAMGRKVRLFPDVTVVHLEGYSTGEAAIPSQSKMALGELNRAKFLGRWGAYLAGRDPQELVKARTQYLPGPVATSAAVSPVSVSPVAVSPPARALLFTPYDLTPGGGERYLFSIASSLADRHDVTIAVRHPYSMLRLNALGKMLDLDLSRCHLVTESELPGLADFDVMVTMGNLVVPPIRGRARHNVYHCQFPFKPGKDDRFDIGALDGYDSFLVNSGYTRAAVERQLYQRALPTLPVHVAFPPVPGRAGDADHKKPMILNVGRFFVGGHSKRHDRLIEAFRVLHRRIGDTVELHLAGSSIPGTQHMDYLRSLQKLAEGLPVVFHVNSPNEKLDTLYRDAAVYWHGTGLGADLTRNPELAEHFGIAIVEAMSAQCVAFALKAGGAPEIIEDGETGFLYRTEAELIARTQEILSPAMAERRMAIGRRAGARAGDFSPDAFAARIRDILP